CCHASIVIVSLPRTIPSVRALHRDGCLTTQVCPCILPFAWNRSQLNFLYQGARGDHMKLRQQVFTILAFVAVVAMLPASAMAEQPVTLHGSVPAWANSSNFAGAADPNENVGFRVYLGWSGADAAEALAHAV